MARRAAAPRKRQTYTDRQRYIVFVLWLHGLTESEAAMMAGLRRKQVAGIIARSDYRNRAAMSFAERFEKLCELKANRTNSQGKLWDDGILPDRVFTPRP